MNIITKKTIQTKITRRIEIGRDALLKLLASQGECGLDNALIYIMVPGGGDWSNMQLDLSDTTPLVVVWDEIRHDEE